MNQFCLSKSLHQRENLPVASTRGLHRREAWDRLSRAYYMAFESQLDAKADLPQTLAELIHQCVSLGEVWGVDVEAAYRSVTAQAQ